MKRITATYNAEKEERVQVKRKNGSKIGELRRRDYEKRGKKRKNE